jgi:hypothetical protein
MVVREKKKGTGESGPTSMKPAGDFDPKTFLPFYSQ